MKAAVFDFDGTLTKDIVPQFAILDKCGLEGGAANPKFFDDVHRRAEREGINIFEAMVWEILDYMKGAGFRLTDKNLGLGAESREFNPGVEEFVKWLGERGVKTYILSSGSKAYLEQIAIAPLFTGIYATTMNYDENGEATDIDVVMTVEQKVKALQEIAKSVNGSEEDCRGVVYFGDGPTDLAAFEFVKQHGGKAILVYRDLESDEAKAVLQENVIDKAVPIDYRANSPLRQYISELM